MKNNTERAKSLLEQCLNSMPSDFALRDARLHIANALREIKKVEMRRDRRTSTQMTPEQKWKLDMETGSLMAPPLSAQQGFNVLANLEQMIQAEEQKTKQPKDYDPDQSGLITD